MSRLMICPDFWTIFRRKHVLVHFIGSLETRMLCRSDTHIWDTVGRRAKHIYSCNGSKPLLCYSSILRFPLHLRYSLVSEIVVLIQGCFGFQCFSYNVWRPEAPGVPNYHPKNREKGRDFSYHTQHKLDPIWDKVRKQCLVLLIIKRFRMG